jgi:hypothetical protein
MQAMNSDDFEKHLQRQPLRPIPAQWRAEILQQATAASTRNPKPETQNRSFLSALLWPHPKAWAGLATVWILIVTLRFASQDKLSNTAQATPSSSQAIAVNLKEQQQILAELMETSGAAPEIDRPKPFVPQPHSERRTPTAMA